MQKKPVVLIILDGFGHSEDHQYNAISIANTPNWDNLKLNYPHGLINASEEHVGLPNGQMGNSEVGHLSIGSGRVLYQDIARINNSVNIPLDKLAESIDKLKKNSNKTLIIYCQKGFQSAQAVKILNKLGVDSVVSIEGGLEAWRKENLPIIMDS